MLKTGILENTILLGFARKTKEDSGQDGRWGDTLEEVVYSPYQFTPANLIYQTTPTELNYTAVDLVLQNGCTLPPYVLYFRANHHFDWEGYKPHTQIDLVCFGYFEGDVE